MRHGGAIAVAPGFVYESGSNPTFLSVAQLRDLIHGQMKPRRGVERREVAA